MKTAAELLNDYASRGSEESFAELVHSHVDLVYSTALRRTGFDTHLAQDVTQQVFADLAQKARRLPKDTVLPGWLHRHTCFRSSQAVRTEQRRRTREEKAVAMQTSENDAEMAWKELAPVLDEALTKLNAADRDAIILRFFERRDLREVGSALGVGEDAAQKRVSRALDRLRALLGKQGIATGATTLAYAIEFHGVAPAPSGMAAAAIATALAKSGGAGVTVFSILKYLAMKKITLALIAATAVVVVLTPVAIHLVDHVRAAQHLGAPGQTDPNGTLIHNGMAEQFGISTKDWAVDISLAPGRFGIKSRSLSPVGSAASSSVAWDRTADWFAYIPAVQPAEGVDLIVFDGHDNAWQVNATGQGVSVKSINQLDQKIPAPVLKRLPNSFKEHFMPANK